MKVVLSGVLVCCGAPQTNLEVVIEAELEVANRSTRVSFQVRTQEGDVALSEQFDLVQTPFPIRRLIAPRGGDASRVVTITAQAVNANGDTLTTARTIRSFIQGRTVEVRLRLYELCLGTNCPEGLSCEPINGRAECVDARVIDNPNDGGVDADANTCHSGQLFCNGNCVDTRTDESHCGACGNVCPSGQLCSSGTCEVVPCDGPADCAQGSYCNPNVGRCLSGCDEPTDCGDNSSCNLSSNQCECAAGFHPCSSGCLPNNVVTSCGDRCSPCEGLTNGTASCQQSADTFVCAAMCNDGFNLCNGSCTLASSPASCGPSCTVCLGSSRGTAICNAGTCSLSCNLGTTMCPVASGLDCVDTTSDLNHCGMCGRVCSGGQVCQSGDCIEPPNCDVNNPASCIGLTFCNPANNRCAPGCDPRLSNQCGSSQTCTTNQCVCVAGTHDCSGVCLSNSSVNSCGTTSCSPCSLITNATQMGCNGTGCTVTTCSTGYQPSSNQLNCEDINECLTNNGGCHVNATCSNTPGSRTCTCDPGFTGNGFVCMPYNSTPTWRQVTTTGPSARGNHAMTYDRTLNRAVLFGGSNSNTLSDTWVFSGTTWSEINGTGPPRRRNHAMAYDITLNRVVLFGGVNNTRFGDTWIFSGTTWSQINDTGPVRSTHAMVYDSTLNEMTLFGGENISNLGDTWLLAGSTWIRINVTGPSERAAHAMVYDSTLNRVVLFGGNNQGSDTWVFSGTIWSQITGPGPSTRRSHAMVYDSTLNRVVLFGGFNGSNRLNDTWVLSGSTWSQITGPAPSARQDHAMAYDSTLNRVVLFGGYNNLGQLLNDTWVFE